MYHVDTTHHIETCNVDRVLSATLTVLIYTTFNNLLSTVSITIPASHYSSFAFI